MNSTNTLTEGNDALNRALLMMRYDLGKTLDENLISEQADSKFPLNPESQEILKKGEEDLKKSAELNKQDEQNAEDWLKKYIQLNTPLNKSNNSDTIIIPKESEYVMWKNTDDRKKIFFKTWVGTSRMSEIPDENTLKQILPNGTLRYFYTPDGISWGCILSHTEGKKDWVFRGYKNKKSNTFYDYKKYVKEPIPKSLTDDPSWIDYIENYFETHDWVKEILWIVGAALAGALTGGIGAALVLEGALASELSLLGIRVSTRLLAAYLGEAAVWSTKAGIEFSEGKNVSGAIDLFFGFVLPIMHETYLAKVFGNGVTRNEITLLGNKLMGKSPDEIKNLYLKSAAEGGLKDSEKKLFKKIMTTPLEKWKEGVVETVEGASSKLVSSGKDPSQTLWEIMSKNNINIFKEMSWYKKIPVTLVHDLAFILLIKKISDKFGIVDFDPKLMSKISKVYQENGGGEKAVKLINEAVEKSETKEEFETILNKILPENPKPEKPQSEILNDPDLEGY